MVKDFNWFKDLVARVLNILFARDQEIANLKAQLAAALSDDAQAAQLAKDFAELKAMYETAIADDQVDEAEKANLAQMVADQQAKLDVQLGRAAELEAEVAKLREAQAGAETLGTDFEALMDYLSAQLDKAESPAAAPSDTLEGGAA